MNLVLVLEYSISYFYLDPNMLCFIVVAISVFSFIMYNCIRSANFRDGVGGGEGN